MKGKKGNLTDRKMAAVVGIVDSAEAVSTAKRLPQGGVDYLEWRADFLGEKIPKSHLPWIITARLPLEGGKNALTLARRRELLLSLLPSAALVDIEVRSLAGLKDVASCGQRNGIGIIASFHDFEKTPATSRLREVIRRAKDSGANVVKIATRTTTPKDVSRLLDLWNATPLPLAIMGMGPLGMSSRLLFANCGSVLNYGWLHSPNVAGQWSAAELRTLITKIGVDK
jgi:3-dehydroquinate dehydratase-1